MAKTPIEVGKVKQMYDLVIYDVRFIGIFAGYLIIISYNQPITNL